MFNTLNNYVSQAKEIATKVLTDLDDGGSHDEEEAGTAGPLQKLKKDASAATQLITNAASMLGDNEPFLSLIDKFVHQNLPALDGERASLFYDWVVVYEEFKQRLSVDSVNKLQHLAKKIGKVLESDPELSNWHHELQNLRARNAQLSDEIAALNNQQWGSFDTAAHKSTESLHAPSTHSSVSMPLTAEGQPMLSSGSDQFEAIELSDGNHKDDADFGRQESTVSDGELSAKLAQLKVALDENAELRVSIDRHIEEKERLMIDAQATEASSIKVITELRATLDDLRANHTELSNKHSKLTGLYEKLLRSSSPDPAVQSEMTRLQQLVNSQQESLKEVQVLMEKLETSEKANEELKSHVSKIEKEHTYHALSKLQSDANLIDTYSAIGQVYQTIDTLINECKDVTQHNYIPSIELAENSTVFDAAVSDIARLNRTLTDSKAKAAPDVSAAIDNVIANKNKIVATANTVAEVAEAFRGTVQHVFAELALLKSGKSVNYDEEITKLLAEMKSTKATLADKLHGVLNDDQAAQAVHDSDNLLAETAAKVDAFVAGVTSTVTQNEAHQEVLAAIKNNDRLNAEMKETTEKYSKLLTDYQKLQNQAAERNDQISAINTEKQDLGRLLSVQIETVEPTIKLLSDLMDLFRSEIEQQSTTYHEFERTLEGLRLFMIEAEKTLTESGNEKEVIDLLMKNMSFAIDDLVNLKGTEVEAFSYAATVTPILNHLRSTCQEIVRGIGNAIQVYDDLDITTDGHFAAVQSKVTNLVSQYDELSRDCTDLFNGFSEQHGVTQNLRTSLLEYVKKHGAAILQKERERNENSDKFAQFESAIHELEAKYQDSVQQVASLTEENTELKAKVCQVPDADEEAKRELQLKQLQSLAEVQEKTIVEQETELQRASHALKSIEERLVGYVRHDAELATNIPEGVDVATAAIAHFEKRIAELKAFSEQKDAEILNLKEELDKSSSYENTIKAAFEEKVATATATIADFGKHVAELKAYSEQQSAEIQNMKDALEASFNNERATKTAYEAVRAELEQKTRLSETAESANALKQEYEEAKHKLQLLEHENNENRDALHEATMRISALQDLLRDKDDELEKAQSQINEYLHTIRLQNQQQPSADELTRLQHLTTECERLRLEMITKEEIEADLKHHIKNITDTLGRRNDEIEHNKKVLQALREELQSKDTDLNDIIAERDEAIHQLRSNDGGSGELKKIVQSQSRDLTQLQQKRNELVFKVKQLTEHNDSLVAENTNKARANEGLQQRLAEAEQEIKRLTTELSNVPEATNTENTTPSQALNDEVTILRQQFIMLRESFSKLILDGKRQADHYNLIISLLDYDPKVREVLHNFVRAREPGGGFDWFYSRFNFQNVGHLADQLVTFVEQENAKNNVSLAPPTQAEPAVHLSLEPDNIESSSELDGLKDIL